MLNDSSYLTYISSHPHENHQYIRLFHDFMQKTYPDCIFSLDNYIPTYTLNGKVILRFHVYKHHIGVFPGSDAIKHVHHQLSNFRSSKKAIQIPKNIDFPIELIRNLVDFNKKTNEC